MWILRILSIFPKILKLARRIIRRKPKTDQGRERKSLFAKIRDRIRGKDEPEVKEKKDDYKLDEFLGKEDNDDDFDIKKLLIPLAVAGVGAAAYAGSTGGLGRWGDLFNGDKSGGQRHTAKGETLSGDELKALNDSTHQRKYGEKTNTSTYQVGDTDQIQYWNSKKYKGETAGSGSVMHNLFNIRVGSQEVGKNGFEGGVEVVTERNLVKRDAKGKAMKDENGNVIYERDENGNIKRGDVSIGSFAVYSDVAYGISRFADLHTYKTYAEDGHKPTMKHFMNKFAPSDDDNDPDKYVRWVESNYGIKADEILDFKSNKHQFIQMAKALAMKENKVTISDDYLDKVWEWKYNGGDFPTQTRNGKVVTDRKVLEDAPAEAEQQTATEVEPKTEDNAQHIVATAQNVKPEPTDGDIVEELSGNIKTEKKRSAVTGTSRSRDEVKIVSVIPQAQPQQAPIPLVTTRSIYSSNETTREMSVTNFNPNGI